MRDHPFLGKGILLWGDLLNILSFLSHKEIYHKVGHLCRDGFMVFRRERELKASPLSCRSEARFLSRVHCHDKVLLVSYPRSGNSYLRRLLESELGIVTGSDSRNNRTLSAALLRCGFKGEGIVDDSCWIVKSHYPERSGFLRFHAHRVILLVRNPFDAIESYFHMGFTNTHDKRLTQASFETLKEIWKDFVPSEGRIWKHFHEYWISKANQLPILVVRYEDLLRNKEEAMEAILHFLGKGPTPCGSKSIKRASGGVGTSRVGVSSTVSRSDSKMSSSLGDAVVASAGPGYAPKFQGVGAVGKSLRLISDDDIDNFAAAHAHLLDYFGYKLLVHEKQVQQVGSDQHQLSADDISYMHKLDESRKYLGLICSSENVAPSLLMQIPHAEITPTRAGQSSPDSMEAELEFKEIDPKLKNLLINDEFCVRTSQDKYGRAITPLRRGFTNDDCNPFPVTH